ncbi:Hha toxicity attenuator, partial [Escherichia coli]|uniref:Hha toxicity attenuator n=1 Tax=Escherichia coli TaxID=562 RepID=UPI0028E09793
GGTADRNRSHWSTSKTPSYTKSVSWHHYPFALNYKIKYNEDNKLIEQIDEYLDDTFMLFSSYGINMQDLQKWRKSGNRLFRCFVNATKENPASLSC